MKYRFLTTIAISSALSTGAFAGAMGPVKPVDDWRLIVALSGGPVWGNAGETQTVFLAPDIRRTYVAQKLNTTFFSGEVLLGVQKALSPSLLAQVGIAGAATNNVRLQGIIWDDADPRFANYTYRYKVQNSRVALKTKFLFDRGYWVMPWVSGSAGVGFNSSHDFTNTPLIFQALPNENFLNHNQTSFTYTLGIGLQRQINRSWQVGVGYEFADWGKSHLGLAEDQTVVSYINLNHVYTNGVMFNLTYLA